MEFAQMSLYLHEDTNLRIKAAICITIKMCICLVSACSGPLVSDWRSHFLSGVTGI
jgi:hypothetical protein